MLRSVLSLFVALLLAACSSEKNEATRILEESLINPRDLEFRDLETYPGGVVCGEFSAYTPATRMKTDFAPFMTVRQKLYNPARKKDLAFYCTENSAQVLLETTGIGPYDANNTELAQITADLDALDIALEAYYIDHYFYPTAEQGLGALVARPEELDATQPYPEGGYIESVPSDPWGRSYLYEEEQWGRTKGNFTVTTLGADGVAGGGGKDADISTLLLPYLRHLAVVLEKD
ncbi:MAG: type II secretion system major pseudopilin GspG [Pseudomonadales bacterium]|nr:type II secretion system major pseudopilin GspG [Halioglobus sp.]MCP5131178.1 type II secretion system major pseudopilin GspG [Pseudomonadales bacterium]